VTPRRAFVAVAVALAVLAMAPAAAAARRPRVGARVVAVHVRPAIAGVPVVLHGRRYRTNAAGEVHVLATPRELANRGILLRDHLRVPPARLGARLRVRLSRWVGHTASIVLLRPVRVRLVDPGGRLVDPAVAPRVGVRGTDGTRAEMPTGGVAWLPAVRAIVRPGGRWRARLVSFAVQDVAAYGANVVNRAQQRFEPERSGDVTVKVLFFAARVHARDALFGGPAGDAVVVRYPDGHTQRLPLGDGGDRGLGGLPRGDYLLRITGSGLSFARPIALSRSQDVTLQVITWADLGLAAGIALLGLFALELARRRLLHRARRARLVGAAAEDHG
jgi:hypothetical protein